MPCSADSKFVLINRVHVNRSSADHCPLTPLCFSHRSLYEVHAGLKLTIRVLGLKHAPAHLVHQITFKFIYFLESGSALLAFSSLKDFCYLLAGVRVRESKLSASTGKCVIDTFTNVTAGPHQCIFPVTHSFIFFC